MKTSNISASFRDPSGFIFQRDGVFYRQVNQIYAADYDHLIQSGLYKELVETGRLIAHDEVEIDPENDQPYKILKPEQIPFISYPYEWTFGQLRSAALTTLSIQKRALGYHMSLKDASAYNIQFLNGRAALIDTLSFEIYQEGEPWSAYCQFCQHFLAPLALMAYCDIRLGQLLRNYIDGIPLDLASKILPGRTRWNLGLVSHIHVHARAQQKFADVKVDEARHGRRISKEAHLMLVENLRKTVTALRWNPSGTEWGDYYENTNYSETAFSHKKEIVETWTRRINPVLVWDLGANRGEFSRVAGVTGGKVIAWDIDPAAVEAHWKSVRAEKRAGILPLLLDLTNPSPAIGWNNQERVSLSQRAPVDMLLALALIHHLAISNNLPFVRIAEAMAGWGTWLVIEFIPKSDEQVGKLLRSRKDIFIDYDRESFEKAFTGFFEILEKIEIHDSARCMYLMKRR